ncbi:MAG TPA: glycosyltransferase family 2 protein [Acidimicrobiia bacterium]|nr:glycosyltransferase family 2 protein [Acidimicrobiia bacterium]
MTLSSFSPSSTRVRRSVAAVIVNWNTADLLEQCLQSLHDHGDAITEVVVVDNGSTDDSVAMVRERWPDSRLIANAENRGYQAANNQGMRVATADYLLLINADAMLTPGCLTRLLERFDHDGAAAVVGPRLVYGDGRFQRWTAGRLPSLRSVGVYAFFIDRFFPRSGVWIGSDVHDAFQPGWVSSACMLVRRSSVEAIGLMDEQFFAYMDDVDLCARVREIGGHVWYEPAATAVHLMGQSSMRQIGAASPLALGAFVQWFADRRGARAAQLMQAIVAAGFALRAALYGAAGLVRPTWRSAAKGHARNVRLTLRPVDARAAKEAA